MSLTEDSKFCMWPDGLTAQRTDGYLIIMPLVAPTHQLRLSCSELIWSVGAECGNDKSEHIICLLKFSFVSVNLRRYDLQMWLLYLILHKSQLGLKHFAVNYCLAF